MNYKLSLWKQIKSNGKSKCFQCEQIIKKDEICDMAISYDGTKSRKFRKDVFFKPFHHECYLDYEYEVTCP